MSDVLPPLEDRIVGCLLGGALGDALGSRFEGTDGAGYAGEPGPISDDTQLTLATCDAIFANAGARGVDPATAAWE